MNTAHMPEAKDILLRLPRLSFSHSLLDYYRRNEAFLEEFEPKRAGSFYTCAYQTEQLRKEKAEAENQTAFRFYLFLKTDPQALIGSVALSNIVRGCFLSCFLGYKLDQDHRNKGYMTQAIRSAVRFAFDELRLHRIEANVMPRNPASRRVLEKCGFREEGFSPQYLKINGVWEDHVHMVLLNETQ
jgi:ribosomal-protein-alanine N-acetyltransferase